MSSPDGSTVTFRRVGANLARRTIERFAGRLETEVAKGRAFDCLISGDAELRRLNRDFRGKDYATDVLAFPAANNGITAEPRSTRRKTRSAEGSLGDIAISLARARAQARALGHSTEQEIQVLMLHGLLHLLGLDHETDGGHMARVEKRWRARLGLPNGLIERAQP
jgi:probable rRNA maturation factor